MNKKRMLNGYVAIHKPNHPTCYTSENWKGWVYEHRYIMECSLDRALNDDEVVHHLDCDKTNNEPDNLIVLSDRASHIRLHYWIDAGKNVHADYIPKVATYYGRPKPLCKRCNTVVKEHVSEYCSIKCRASSQQRTRLRPTKEELIKLIQSIGYVQVGKLYDVSDNSIRKWVKSYGLDPKTIVKEKA